MFGEKHGVRARTFLHHNGCWAIDTFEDFFERYTLDQLRDEALQRDLCDECEEARTTLG
jgi:hypothetical protein